MNEMNAETNAETLYQSLDQAPFTAQATYDNHNLTCDIYLTMAGLC